MKVRLFVASGIIMLSLCVILIFFYTHMNVETAVSGSETLYSCGYVPYLDAFLSIDINGKVLTVTKNKNDNVPVIEGLTFDQFSVGGCLDEQNRNALDATARLLSLFRKYDLDNKVITKIDVANLNDIHLYTDNIYITFGSIQNADTKIRVLKEILAELRISEGVKGLLDIRVIGRQYIFTVLT